LVYVKKLVTLIGMTFDDASFICNILYLTSRNEI